VNYWEILNFRLKQKVA